MPRTIALLWLCAFTLIGHAQTVDDILAKTCPPRMTHALDADETAILEALAKHYRQHEWSSEQARKEGTFAHVTYARHSVPALKAPQFVSLTTMPLQFVEAPLNVELQRHEVPQALADALRNSLRARNSAPVSLRLRDDASVRPLSCRDLYTLAFSATKPPDGDYRNLAKTIVITLPAFDPSRTTALIASVNDLEYAFEGKLEDVELTLLRKSAAKGWRIEWDAAIGSQISMNSAPAAPATPADYAVFDALLAHLDRPGCVFVVNQTLPTPVGPLEGAIPREIFSAAEDAARDMAKRSAASVYIGKTYAPQRSVKFIQREAIELLQSQSLSPCKTAIRFYRPGYSGPDTAVAGFTLQTLTESGIDVGQGWAIVKRTGKSWRVDKYSYQRWMLVPRH